MKGVLHEKGLASVGRERGAGAAARVRGFSGTTFGNGHSYRYFYRHRYDHADRNGYYYGYRHGAAQEWWTAIGRAGHPVS
jgi:hypothetical protein